MRLIVLEISDFSGKLILSKSMNHNAKHWLWDTREIVNGIYFYRLTGSNIVTPLQGKIVIQK